MPNRSNEKKRSALKGRFGGIVDMTEDISPPPATKNRRNIAVSPVVVGLSIEISNRFLHDFEAAITIAKQCKAEPCHKPPLSKGGLEGL